MNIPAFTAPQFQAASRQQAPSQRQVQRAAAADSVQFGQSQPPRPVRVLLVEDHPILKDIIKFKLQAMPNVEFLGLVESEAEVLTAFQQANKPDMVLLDNNLPNGQKGVDIQKYLVDQLGIDPARILFISDTAIPDKDRNNSDQILKQDFILANDATLTTHFNKAYYANTNP